jgi:pullulanase/glycogen debranching enzyme
MVQRSMDVDVWPGSSFPLGAKVSGNGVNFSLFSKSTTAVELLLFDDAEAEQPSSAIQLDPVNNKRFTTGMLMSMALELDRCMPIGSMALMPQS